MTYTVSNLFPMINSFTWVIRKSRLIPFCISYLLYSCIWESKSRPFISRFCCKTMWSVLTIQFQYAEIYCIPQNSVCLDVLLCYYFDYLYIIVWTGSWNYILCISIMLKALYKHGEPLVFREHSTMWIREGFRLT